jgi:REP element-mobilizing transposase RayT
LGDDEKQLAAHARYDQSVEGGVRLLARRAAAWSFGRKARPLRIDPADTFHPAMNRGNKRRAIFHDDRDREGFIERPGRCSERCSFRIYTYVLMGIHHHLLVRTGEANLSAAIQWLGVSYAPGICDENSWNSRTANPGSCVREIWLRTRFPSGIKDYSGRCDLWASFDSVAVGESERRQTPDTDVESRVLPVLEDVAPRVPNSIG